MDYIADIILIAAVVIAFIVGWRKGLIDSVWKVIAIAVSMAVTAVLKDPIVGYMSGTEPAAKLTDWLVGMISVPQGGGVDMAESLHLPLFMQDGLRQNLDGIQNSAAPLQQSAAASVTDIALTIFVCVAVFILTRVLLVIIHRLIINIVKSTPLNGINRFIGGVLGIINILAITLVALWLVTLFAPAGGLVVTSVEKSYIVKYLYDHNILLQFLMNTI